MRFPFPLICLPYFYLPILSFQFLLRLFSQEDDNLIFRGKFLAKQFVNSRLDEAAFCRFSASVSVDAFTILAISQKGEQFFNVVSLLLYL